MYYCELWKNKLTLEVLTRWTQIYSIMFVYSNGLSNKIKGIIFLRWVVFQGEIPVAKTSNIVGSHIRIYFLLLQFYPGYSTRAAMWKPKNVHIQIISGPLQCYQPFLNEFLFTRRAETKRCFADSVAWLIRLTKNKAFQYYVKYHSSSGD